MSQRPDYDPSLNVIWPPFTTALNQYFRAELGYENDLEYHILRGLEWNWGDAKDGYADTSAPLREAMAKTPTCASTSPPGTTTWQRRTTPPCTR